MFHFWRLPHLTVVFHGCLKVSPAKSPLSQRPRCCTPLRKKAYTKHIHSRATITITIITAPSLLTCTEEDDLVVQRQLGEVGDPLGPLHQGEELLVCCLTDVGDRVVGLRVWVNRGNNEELLPQTVAYLTRKILEKCDYSKVPGQNV